MKKSSGKHVKETLLANVAESIGTTFATLAAKADAARKVLTQSSIAQSVEQEGGEASAEE